MDGKQQRKEQAHVSKKEIGQATILANERIAPGIFRMRLNAPAIARAANPGQFVNLYTDSAAMLLPRPISISDVDGDGLTLIYAVVGKGTEEFSHRTAGERIRLLGPNGQGYLLPPDSGQEDAAAVPRILLVGGGLGIPPLLFAARRLRSHTGEGRARGQAEPRPIVAFRHEDAASMDSPPPEITALLGFRESPWYVGEMEKFCDAVLTISENAGPSRGVVTDLLHRLSSDMSGAVVLSCGPRPMLKAVSEWCRARDIPVQVSMEERMGCGVGVCVGCTCRIAGEQGQVQNRKVCSDGPVFDGRAVIW
jgi:dihydroorotate dehydrogenase electron transfer subunit